MSFDTVMGTVMQWATAAEALAAVGAEVGLAQSGAEVSPEVTSALRAVSNAAGLGDLDELEPQQKGMVAAMARLYLVQALDILDSPDRAGSWTFTDPVILDGWGRGSMLMPGLINGTVPGVGETTSFLDIGTGVGLLAVAAASVWPNARIVGIDIWEPALARARANVAQAGLEGRIELRAQNVVDLDDADRFDLIWVPTFFLSEATLVQAFPALLRAAQPGATIVLGLWQALPNPLAAAVTALRTVRSGGEELEAKRGVDLLEAAGFTDVRHVTPQVPAPLDFIVGQKPAA